MVKLNACHHIFHMRFRLHGMNTERHNYQLMTLATIFSLILELHDVNFKKAVDVVSFLFNE